MYVAWPDCLRIHRPNGKTLGGLHMGYQELDEISGHGILSDA